MMFMSTKEAIASLGIELKHTPERFFVIVIIKAEMEAEVSSFMTNKE
jgi:hypothetical protein